MAEQKKFSPAVYYLRKMSYINRNESVFKYFMRQKQPPEVFYENGVIKNFAKFTGKHMCQSLFFNKVAGLRLY